MIQFRGDGALAIRLARPLVRVKLPASGLVFVDAERIAGWIGRVIPRAVVSPEGGPLGTTCVECTGEGIVLVEPAEPAPATPLERTAATPASPSGPPPVPPPPLRDPEPDLLDGGSTGEVAPEVAAFAADLAAFTAESEPPPDDETM